jgi:PPE-repeat protein
LGDRNAGDGNLGEGNSGNGNSGYWNSGNGNSGYWNSGNGNSGNWNSGNGVLNSFCTKRQWMLFDILCSEQEYNSIKNLNWSWFWINKWIDESDMTDDEKTANPTYKTCGGYLKKIEYKEAFKAAPKSFIDAVKELKNFDAAKFKEISGLEV